MKQQFTSSVKACVLTAATFFFALMLHAQGLFLVKGHITDASTKIPVIAATVTSKALSKSVVTDADGNFTIQTKTGDVLTINYVGYKSFTATVAGEDFLELTITPAAGNLTDVVVTATGIKKETRRLGYAIQTVDASALTKAKDADPVAALRGQAVGLTINLNSEIGHSPDVIMRGEGRPLFVVDGVPISSDTYNINPDDIESFTILKGPNAAALYGFQGQDGAIIINTKKGSKDKRGFTVDFNSSLQVNKGFIALPKYNDEYGPGDNGDYAFGGGGSSAGSYFGNGAIGVGINDYDYDVWGPKFNGQLLPQYDGKYDPTQTYTTTLPDGTVYQGHIQPTPWVARGANNLKNFLQTGLISGTSIAVSSSSEKTDIRFSVGDTYQTGITPNTQMNNGNFTGSIIERFSKRLTLSAYFNYSRQSSPNIPDVSYGPNSVIYNIIIWGAADWSVKDMRNYWQPGKVGIQQNYEEYYRYNNPYFMSYEWLRSHDQNNVYGYATLDYKATKNIDLTFRPSMTTYDMVNTEKVPYSATVYGNSLHQGNYDEDKRSLFQSNVEAQAKYHKDNILGFLDVSALVGYNLRTLNFTSSFLSTQYLNVPEVYNFSNSQGPLVGQNYNSQMKTVSGYYSADIGYKTYVTLSVTGREDKSSSLPSNNTTYFYPSFNAATAISEYLKLPKVISFLKVRGSYAESKNGGTTAFFSPSLNSSIPASNYGYSWQSPYDGPTYPFTQTYALQPTYNGQNSARYTDQTVSNNIVTADRKALEFGLDLRLLNNLVGLDLTRYHYRNGPAIIGQNISSASGYSSYLTNGNVYTNDGWEVAINATPVKTKTFTWSVIANWSTYIRKWVSDANPNAWEYNGQRIDKVYGDAFVRTPDGKLVIDPSSGDPVRVEADLGSTGAKTFGHSDPDWQWAFINTLTYKSFALRFQFDGQVGGVMQDYVRKKTLQGGREIETTQGALGAARPNDALGPSGYSYVGDGVNLTGAPIQVDPVTGVITNYKSLTESVNTTKTFVQGYVENGIASIPDGYTISKTYAKLREVTLTYALPASVYSKLTFVRNASISLVGRNLLYFFPNRYKDVDVDQYSQSSGSGLQTPTTRNYGFNLSVSF